MKNIHNHMNDNYETQNQENDNENEVIKAAAHEDQDP